MANASDTLWARPSHTAAKHLLLANYLGAWVSILGKYDKDLVLIDGFAGPGEYLGGESGSPLVMLETYEEAAEQLGPNLRARPHFWFVEKRRDRYEHLENLVADKEPLPGGKQPVAEVIHGEFANIFPGIRSQIQSSFGGRTAMFVFLDPFGLDEGAAQQLDGIFKLPSSEVVLYLPTAFIHRFIETPEFRSKLEQISPGEDWASVAELSGRTRVEAVRNAVADRMPCKWVRWIEIKPASTSNSYTLIFGTNHELGLRKMKAAMWKLDPASGTRFKDTTSAGQETLFAIEPNWTAVELLLVSRFGKDRFTVEEAERFLLFDTPYRDDAHLKKPLKSLEKSGRLEAVQAKAGRPSGTYGDKHMVLQFK